MSSKKNRRTSKPKVKPKAPVLTFNSNTRLDEALKAIFASADVGGIAIVVEPDEATWFPFMPDWSGMRFDEEQGKIIGDLQLNDREQIKKQIKFLRIVAGTAEQVADVFEGIANDIEASTGIHIDGNVEETPSADVN